MKLFSTTALFTITSCLFAPKAIAQCGDRYQTEIFSSVNKTTVTYSTPHNLKMDIFEPVGDTLSQRPLVILAFGGSFISGDRASDATIVNLCNTLAKRGYVTASIDYRLAANPLLMLDSAYAITTVVKAVSDGKAAIRYFVKDAATINTYKVDVDNIFAGGNSAGGVLFMHVGYLTDIAEATPGIAYAIGENGGMEGNSGNEGYEYALKGIISLAGGLHNANFVSEGDLSSINFHGDADNVVPYTCARAMGGTFVTLCGLGSLQPLYTSYSIPHESYIYPGKGHCPWSDDPTIYNDAQDKIVEYLYNIVCDEATSVNQLNQELAVNIYPNPAQSFVHISAKEPIVFTKVFNTLGQQLLMIDNTSLSSKMEIPTHQLSSGMYFLEIQGKQSKAYSKVLIQH